MNTQSLVTWTYPNNDQYGYLVEKSSDSGSEWTTLVSCSLETTSYYDNSVTWGDSRWYRVSAINGYGSGPVSSTSQIFINSPGIATPDLSASQFSPFQTGSLLTWNYTGSAEGSTVSFSIDRSYDGLEWQRAWDIDGTASFKIDDPIEPDTFVYYRMKATCDFGLDGPWSNVSIVYIASPP